MVQARRSAVQKLGDLREGLSQLGGLFGADTRPGPLFQAVFDKMLELPHIKVEVEALMKRDAGFIASFGAEHLQFQKLIDGLAIPVGDVGIVEPLDAVPKSRIAKVFEKQYAFAFPTAVQHRHRDADLA